MPARSRSLARGCFASSSEASAELAVSLCPGGSMVTPTQMWLCWCRNSYARRTLPRWPMLEADAPMRMTVQSQIQRGHGRLRRRRAKCSEGGEARARARETNEPLPIAGSTLPISRRAHMISSTDTQARAVRGRQYLHGTALQRLANVQRKIELNIQINTKYVRPH